MLSDFMTVFLLRKIFPQKDLEIVENPPKLYHQFSPFTCGKFLTYKRDVDGFSLRECKFSKKKPIAP